ncbi:hypothetical protein E3N88_16478 [Mikania micrantha]|uniref:Uncharacterized protein n=1 Tax=Mikania micrantha TaxID=192012 RepID=A0A5N6NZR6_9ASTR|nr:hypothetical protein E3N88_16478 [Mikania micrantha]
MLVCTKYLIAEATSGYKGHGVLGETISFKVVRNGVHKVHSKGNQGEYNVMKPQAVTRIMVFLEKQQHSK